MKQHRQPGERTFSWDDPAVLVGVVAVVGLTGWAAWYFGHTEIAKVYVYFRYVELWLFSVVGSFDIPGFSWVHEWVQATCQPEGMFGRCTRNFSTVKWQEISNSSIIINILFVLLITGFCVRMYWRVKEYHPKLKFRKTHNIGSFVQESKELYLHLRMFSELDLIAEPLDHPVFGMSLTSRQFVYQHQLITGWKEESGGSCLPTLNRQRAELIFRLQLGRHWTKSTNLSSAETLLAAIAMPRVAATDASLNDSSFKAALKDSNKVIEWCWAQFNAKSKKKYNNVIKIWLWSESEAREIVSQHKTQRREHRNSARLWLWLGINVFYPKDIILRYIDNPLLKSLIQPNTNQLAWLWPNIDLSYPRKVLNKYIGHSAVHAILKRHAFNRTVIFALFMQARRLGVLQPAEMRWLRFFDRELWYVMETIGRQAGFAEGAAVLSHYLYESKSGAALAEPQVDKAIAGLDLALISLKFTAEDKEKYEKWCKNIRLSLS